MNAEFNWWLLIVGLVLGAALTWLVMAESARRDADVTEAEERSEALWIASVLSSSGRQADGSSVEEVLRLHREYLAAPMPDEPENAPAEALAELGGEPASPAMPSSPVVPAEAAVDPGPSVPPEGNRPST